MKVILSSRSVYPFQGYGGMQRYIYFLGKYLQKQGVEVQIITSAEKNEDSNSREYENIKYNLVHPSVNSPFFHIKYHIFYINVAKRLKKKDFDVLHSFGGSALAYLFLKDRKPTILQPFGNELFKEKGLKKIRNYILFYLESKYLHTHADAIASEGDLQTQEIINLFGVSKDKIFNLPDGVELYKINEYISENKINREYIGFNDDDFVLISVNQLQKIKGLNYLIDAFSIIKQYIDDAKLILIGAGPEEKRLLYQIKTLNLQNSVLHFKNVDDSLLYNYLSLANVYVSPSLQNCLLLSVLEGMACGLPVVQRI